MKTKLRFFKNPEKKWISAIYKGKGKNRKLVIKKKSKNIFKAISIFFNYKYIKEIL